MRDSRAFNIVLLVAAVAYGVYQWRQSADETEPPKAAVISSQQATTELKEFIAHAIKVYSAQDFSEIVKIMPPMEIQALQPRGQNLSLDELAKVLRERPAAIASAQLNLQELLAIQNETPELQEDGTRAVYKLDPPILGQTQVVLVRIGDKWYMP